MATPKTVGSTTSKINKSEIIRAFLTNLGGKDASPSAVHKALTEAGHDIKIGLVSAVKSAEYGEHGDDEVLASLAQAIATIDAAGGLDKAREFVQLSEQMAALKEKLGAMKAA